MQRLCNRPYIAFKPSAPQRLPLSRQQYVGGSKTHDAKSTFHFSQFAVQETLHGAMANA